MFSQSRLAGSQRNFRHLIEGNELLDVFSCEKTAEIKATSDGNLEGSDIPVLEMYTIT